MAKSQFVGNLVARVGEYEKDGKTKGKFLTCGALFRKYNEDGEEVFSVKLEAVPTNTEWLNVYPPKKDDGSTEPSKEKSQSLEDSEDLPF